MELYVKKLSLKNLISSRHLREFWKSKKWIKGDKNYDIKNTLMDVSFYWINDFCSKLRDDVYVLNFELKHKRTTAIEKKEFKNLLEKTLDENKKSKIVAENLLVYNSRHCIKLYNPRTEMYFMIFRPIVEEGDKTPENYLNIQIFLSKEESPTFKKEFHLSKNDIQFILDSKLFN